MKRFGASLRQTCAVVQISRSVYLYRSRARDATALTMRIKEITATRVHYGYRRVHVMLRREGWKDNHKRVYRLYRAEGAFASKGDCALLIDGSKVTRADGPLCNKGRGGYVVEGQVVHLGEGPFVNKADAVLLVEGELPMIALLTILAGL